MLGALAMSPFALFLGSPPHVSHTAPVTGRVTYSGRPFGDATICLDSNGQHSACALIQPDGSFRVVSMTWVDEGALPGHYRAHIYTHSKGPKFPSKYGNPRTSGIELDVAPGWNHFHIDLASSPDDPSR
jgi:hypothetical protein